MPGAPFRLTTERWECRNLYYEETELYGSQARVDQLVDDLAATLGVGRHDLGIVRLSAPSRRSLPNGEGLP